ncbi:hypothetical protein EC973_008567 [Apophysomyces ossiformis]|uniref:Uncharacterized protein n=1 Tax=Apophysomyces ossiformis TaxID=679940 RepID=A0A8H7BMP6_9FUNG|nr:hypothetical protein EC973_008567 [Apophysomyces ossiformis]
MSIETLSEDFALPLGKQLAANEKKQRDKAVRSLKRFLSTGPELSKLDLLKLWKGLFYCFWMSDKPLVQQALANDLGALVLDVPVSNAVPFLSAFWEIHCKEWHGLDRIRLDKYYLLFRRIIHFSFQLLADQNWEEDLVRDYTTMLLEGPLHPTDRTKPDAIRYHIMDLYFEELDKVLDKLQDSQSSDEDMESGIPMDELERPLRVLAKEASYKVTRKRAQENLRQHEEKDTMEE